MSDTQTLIPTMTFRWEIRNILSSPVEKVLQQMFETPGGRRLWRDVPVVMADDSIKALE